jgi:hypothetical protein
VNTFHPGILDPETAICCYTIAAQAASRKANVVAVALEAEVVEKIVQLHFLKRFEPVSMVRVVAIATRESATVEFGGSDFIPGFPQDLPKLPVVVIETSEPILEEILGP